MIKKFLNVFMCIGLLMQNFLFVIPVIAEETKKPTIKINGIYQENQLAESDEDGAYIIDKYEKAVLDLELENVDDTKDYYVKIVNENGGISGSPYEQQLDFYISKYQEIQKYTIKICENWECEEVFATKDFSIKLSFYNDIINSYIIVSDVKQGDKNIEIKDRTDDYYQYLYLNKYQNISFKVTGVNLIDDAMYRISSGNEEHYYTGTELESGVNLVYRSNLYSLENHSTFWIGARMKGLELDCSTKYYDGNDYYDYFNMTYIEEDLTNYNPSIVYTNFRDKEIIKSEVEYRDFYIINSNYHNVDNTLSLNIDGEKYEDKDYSVSVEIIKDKTPIYNKKIDVNGLLLNDGYTFELDNLTLELNKKILDAELYELYVEIDDIVMKKEYNYNSIGKDVYLSANIFFENGKKNLSAFRGDGNYFFGSGIYDTNRDVFTKYSSVYLRFMGENFDYNDTYEYVLEYGNFEDNVSFTERNYEVELKSGEVKGEVLNTTGILFKVDNYKNFANPTYKLTVKKGEEILYSDAPVLYIVNSPTLANASLKANNKNLYLQTSDLSYIATKNAPIDIVISGLGFDEKTEYDFNFCYYKNYSDGIWNEENGKCETIKIKGKDLNNGTAKIHFKDKIDEKAISYNFYVMCDLQTAYEENVAIQGGFDVTFVDSKELFPNLTKYFVDNVSDLIKNISKNTSVEDFTNNIDVKNNGKVKIYDTTGTTEITGNVGTGMIARVVNEYEENVLDLDVVVKGDVSGDGNISITDLVKVKRHLSQDEKLTGVYEMAGNITETGEIGITDLVKISRDVAKIQEVQ